MDEREQRPWGQAEQQAWIRSRLARLRDSWERGQLSWRRMLALYQHILAEFGEQL